MGWFRKIARGVRKLGGKALTAAAAVGVPGVGTAMRAAQAAKSFGEDTKKLRMAQRANLKAGPQLKEPIDHLVMGPTRRISAPRVTLGPTTAARAQTAIRKGQALKLKAGKVSAERQKLLYDEWVGLGKPGTWEEYLLDQVAQGLA